MLFNSYIYFLLFLPAVCGVYFLLAPRHAVAAKIWLAAASLFFYGWWDITYVPLLLASTLFNYVVGKALRRGRAKPVLLFLGLAANLAVLAYFKYADFLVQNVMTLLGHSHEPLNIVLPLAISFFTFQKIAYLVDCYKGRAKEYDLLNFMLFVWFFPQLIAGPIVHHSEMMPQFQDERSRYPQPANIVPGLLLFAVGFFKKVVLADTYALWATPGFDHAANLAFAEAWATSLSYTLQLYFDFSGYTDMAIGAALLFNIRLPFNFNSPYKAMSVQEFWRRWHMTLSRFLRDYIYIPLGGNREKEPRVLTNLFVTFLLGGLWHGAAWTFVLWGALHGAALVICRLWQKSGIRLGTFIAAALTFLFVNAAWVVFRATNLADAAKIYRGMLDFGSIAPVNALWLAALAGGLALVFCAPNSNVLRDSKNISPLRGAVFAGVLLFVSVMVMEVRKTSEFLYFQF